MAKAMRTQCFMVVMKVYLILWRSFEFIHVVMVMVIGMFISMYRDERSKFAAMLGAWRRKKNNPVVDVTVLQGNPTTES